MRNPEVEKLNQIDVSEVKEDAPDSASKNKTFLEKRWMVEKLKKDAPVEWTPEDTKMFQEIFDIPELNRVEVLQFPQSELKGLKLELDPANAIDYKELVMKILGSRDEEAVTFFKQRVLAKYPFILIENTHLSKEQLVEAANFYSASPSGSEQVLHRDMIWQGFYHPAADTSELRDSPTLFADTKATINAFFENIKSTYGHDENFRKKINPAIEKIIFENENYTALAPEDFLAVREYLFGMEDNVLRREFSFFSKELRKHNLVYEHKWSSEELVLFDDELFIHGKGEGNPKPGEKPMITININKFITDPQGIRI